MKNWWRGAGTGRKPRDLPLAGIPLEPSEMTRVVERGFLPAEFSPEQELLEQLSSRPGSQRCLLGMDELLLIVHEVPQLGVPEREPLVFWRKLEEGWMGPDGGKGLGGLAALLDRYQRAIDEHEEEIEETEGAAEIFRVARHAGPLARSTRNMTAALDQAVAHDPENRELIGLRDRSREIERAAELLFHDAKLTLEFKQAERAEAHQEAAERLNVIAFRLNLMAGFFLPVVAMAGLLGMNVELPEFVRPWFWRVLILGLGFGGMMVWLVSGRPKLKR